MILVDSEVNIGIDPLLAQQVIDKDVIGARAELLANRFEDTDIILMLRLSGIRPVTAMMASVAHRWISTQMTRSRPSSPPRGFDSKLPQTCHGHSYANCTPSVELQRSSLHSTELFKSLPEAKSITFTKSSNLLDGSPWP